jgi:BirA family biotin operon repressor/biotin-[acetyl-CoA-carboxylase] ligase
MRYLDSKWWHYHQLTSTNDKAKELAAKGYLKDKAVVIADHQTHGRGQQNASWYSNPGDSLTLSLVVFPSSLLAKDQFWLNMAVSVGILESLIPFLEPVAAHYAIKWPNDLMLEHRKMGGILIENVLEGNYIHQSVVGIGLNLGDFYLEALPQAIGLSSVTEEIPDHDHMAQSLVDKIIEAYRKVTLGNREIIKDRYHQFLYKSHQWHTFKDARGNLFKGCIQGIDELGRLLVLNESNSIQAYGLKNIQF